MVYPHALMIDVSEIDVFCENSDGRPQKFFRFLQMLRLQISFYQYAQPFW